MPDLHGATGTPNPKRQLLVRLIIIFSSAMTTIFCCMCVALMANWLKEKMGSHEMEVSWRWVTLVSLVVNSLLMGLSLELCLKTVVNNWYMIKRCTERLGLLMFVDVMIAFITWLVLRPMTLEEGSNPSARDLLLSQCLLGSMASYGVAIRMFLSLITIAAALYYNQPKPPFASAGQTARPKPMTLPPPLHKNIRPKVDRPVNFFKAESKENATRPVWVESKSRGSDASHKTQTQSDLRSSPGLRSSDGRSSPEIRPSSSDILSSLDHLSPPEPVASPDLRSSPLASSGSTSSRDVPIINLFKPSSTKSHSSEKSIFSSSGSVKSPTDDLVKTLPVPELPKVTPVEISPAVPKLDPEVVSKPTAKTSPTQSILKVSLKPSPLTLPTIIEKSEPTDVKKSEVPKESPPVQQTDATPKLNEGSEEKTGILKSPEK